MYTQIHIYTQAHIIHTFLARIACMRLLSILLDGIQGVYTSKAICRLEQHQLRGNHWIYRQYSHTLIAIRLNRLVSKQEQELCGNHFLNIRIKRNMHTHMYTQQNQSTYVKRKTIFKYFRIHARYAYVYSHTQRKL